MKFKSPVTDIIRHRKSVRTFNSNGLSTDQINQLKALLQANLNAPFGNTVYFSLVDKQRVQETEKVKIGTYGFISGAQYYIVGQVLNTNPMACIDYGYLLEAIILYITEMGLGTCWLGGTFNRSDFLGILKQDDQYIIPAITPVGVSSQKQSRRERIIRWGAGSDNRKNSSDLFFNQSPGTPLTESEADVYSLPLEMVRLAPSASNKQPWRIVKSGDDFHFYLSRTKGYNKLFGGVDLQKVDMGIAMLHFEYTCNQLNVAGKWVVQTDTPPLIQDLEYCFTWVPGKY